MLNNVDQVDDIFGQNDENDKHNKWWFQQTNKQKEKKQWWKQKKMRKPEKKMNRDPKKENYRIVEIWKQLKSFIIEILKSKPESNRIWKNPNDFFS